MSKEEKKAKKEAGKPGKPHWECEPPRGKELARMGVMEDALWVCPACRLRHQWTIGDHGQGHWERYYLDALAFSARERMAQGGKSNG